MHFTSFTTFLACLLCESQPCSTESVEVPDYCQIAHVMGMKYTKKSMLCFGLKINRSLNVIMDESELELKIREMKIPVARLIPDAGKSLAVSGLHRKSAFRGNFI